MIYKPLICWLFLISFWRYSPAQQLFFSKYTVSDGLVNNEIRNLFQDSKGFLWISTWEGLSKYDGHRFTNFKEGNGLSHNLVNDVIETNTGDIYVAMNNGTVDVIKNDEVKQKRIVTNVTVNKLEYTKNGILLGLTDNHGIIRLNENLIEYISNPGGISFYDVVDLNDSLIALASDTLPVSIYNRQFRVWSTVKSRLNNAIAHCVYKDLQNRLWLGTSTGLKLVSIDYDKIEIKLQEPPAPFDSHLLSQVMVTSIFQQKNGTFWIGTNNGLINILPNGRLIQLTENNGLPSRAVSCIFNDRENNIWVGTTLGIAKIIAPSPVAIEGPLQPYLASLIKKISADEVLIESGSSFYRYNFKTARTDNIMQLNKGEPFMYVTNSDPLLFIFKDQLYRYNSVINKLTAVRRTLPGNFYQPASTIDQETIFIGTYNGIIISSDEKTVKDSAFSMRINNLLADQKGFLWVGTWENGLYRAKFDISQKKFTEIIKISQLPDKHIRSLFEDSNGNIWVGTRYSGAVKVIEKTPNNFQLVHKYESTGLSSNWVGDITEDKKGNIWLATKSGIDKLIKKGDSFSVFNYSRIINLFSNTNLITYTEDNKLFCSSLQGMFQITDEEFEEYAPQPVYLTKIALGSAGQNQLALQNVSENFILPYSKNHALFEFTSPIYLNEKEILYSYRLKGTGDTIWSHPSNNHSVQYASLEPGHYRFEVRMLGWNGTYGPVSSFVFTIRPPYWNTWWFYSLIVLVVSLLLYSFYRYRINQLLRLQKVRNTIATDLHDDIGSTLTNISILSELSKKNLEQPQQARIYLERINEEVNSSGQALDDIIWNVNSKNDTMEEMLIRMRRFAAELFEDTPTSYYLELDPHAASKRLSMEQRRDIYLVFKESLNNIFKHAEAKTVWVELSMVDHCVQLIIRDDGKGFNPEDPTHRNGLNNIKKRVEKWKGRIKISSQTRKGSAIEIMMPFDN